MNDLNITIQKKSLETEGDMINDYSPFHNLIDETGLIKDFSTSKLEINLDKPVEIEVQPSFDGSVNLILNDDNDIPKLINSRFSVLEDSTYVIPDHFGNKDTNLYDETDLRMDTSLYKTISKIPKLEFLGLDEGFMKSGSYYFYFKLCDNDGNSSDFIAESGLVMCHKGNLNDPFSISMGMEDENSNKSVKFKLTNSDESYDFVKVFYSRTTSGKTQVDVDHVIEIDYKYPLESGIIKITGLEPELKSTKDIINFKYELASQVKSQAICDNKLFFGNINKPKIPYDTLKNLSLKIFPTIEYEKDFYDVNYNYEDHTYSKNGSGYYNALNNYNKVSYFPEEFYRLGIVYIMSDFSCSPVFNTRGINFLQNSLNDEETEKILNSEIITYDDDGYISNTNKTQNIYGIINTGKQDKILTDRKPIYINLKLNDIALTDDEKILLGKLDDTDKESVGDISKQIKGFFYVRQNRLPTFLAQGIAIGKTKDGYGNLPVLKTNGKYFSESFLTNKTVTQSSYGKTHHIKGNILQKSFVNVRNNDIVNNQTLLIPDAEQNEEEYSGLFTSNEYQLSPYGNAGKTYQNNNLFYQKNYTTSDEPYKLKKSKLTLVSAGVPLISNGSTYFSSKAGDKFQLNQVSSIRYDWENVGVDSSVSASKNVFAAGEKAPLVNELSEDRYIRGVFGGYVGSSSTDLDYADIVNIRPKDFEYTNEYYQNCISARKIDTSTYHPITDKLEIDTITDDIKCFRGDCFITTYTHKMISPYIDPETPTNNTIVSPLSWFENFKVMTKANTGGVYINEPIPMFKARNPESNVLTKWLSAIGGLITAGSIIGMGFDSAINDSDPGITWWDEYKRSNVEVLLPGSSKYGNPGGTGEMFGIPGNWNEYGLDKISRSDVNAVPIGHWITYSVLSNYNLAYRSEDIYKTDEANLLHQKRGFYPLNKIDDHIKVQDSTMMNGCINKTLNNRNYHIMPDVPYIKQQFDNRIIYSESASSNAFKNGFRIFPLSNYQDYPKEYGAIVKVIEYSGSLIVIMEHGVYSLTVHEKILTGQSGAGGDGLFINTDKVLPSKPQVVSDTFGTLFKESVVQTSAGIYGIDTVAKKIWLIKLTTTSTAASVTDTPILLSRPTLTILSDMKIEKFLNQNIDITEFDKFYKFGKLNIKSTYNSFKKDVMFSYNYIKTNDDGSFKSETKWNVCFNEYLKVFTTFYSWMPMHMANIDTLNFSIDNDKSKEYLFGFTNNDIKNNLLLQNLGLSTYYLAKNWSNIYYIDLNTMVLSLDSTFSLDENETNFSIVNNDLVLVNKPDGEYDLLLNKTDEESTSQITLHFFNNENKSNYYLWKHGQSGNFTTEQIKPTTWFGHKRKFEFEFIVAKDAMVQKVFNNLMMISNSVEPAEIEMDVVGDSYEFSKYKTIIMELNDQCDEEYSYPSTISKATYLKSLYKEYLKNNTKIKKLPFLPRIRKEKNLSTNYNGYEVSTSSVWLVYDELSNETRIRSNQSVNNIQNGKYNIVNANAQYIEDIWKFQITPINFKYVYYKNEELKFTKSIQAPLRDKYCRIRIKYSGDNLAIIQAINTLYDISYA